jgi:hypothetical protein
VFVSVAYFTFENAPEPRVFPSSYCWIFGIEKKADEQTGQWE